MARKKAKKEVSRKEINGNIIITFDDGSVQIIPAPIDLTAEEAASIFGDEEDAEEEEDEEDAEEEDEDDDEDDDEGDEDEDEDDSDDDDDAEEDEEEEADEEVTPEQLANMDFEELEDLCDDQGLDVDPDDYDEEDIEKMRRDIAKELGITLPKASKKSTKKGKK